MNEEKYKIVRNGGRKITNNISEKEYYTAYRITQDDFYTYENEIYRSTSCSDCEQAIKEDIEWRNQLND